MSDAVDDYLAGNFKALRAARELLRASGPDHDGISRLVDHLRRALSRDDRAEADQAVRLLAMTHTPRSAAPLLVEYLRRRIGELECDAMDALRSASARDAVLSALDWAVSPPASDDARSTARYFVMTIKAIARGPDARTAEIARSALDRLREIDDPEYRDLLEARSNAAD